MKRHVSEGIWDLCDDLPSLYKHVTIWLHSWTATERSLHWPCYNYFTSVRVLFHQAKCWTLRCVFSVNLTLQQPVSPWERRVWAQDHPWFLRPGHPGMLALLLTLYISTGIFYFHSWHQLYSVLYCALCALACVCFLEWGLLEIRRRLVHTQGEWPKHSLRAA